MYQIRKFTMDKILLQFVEPSELYIIPCVDNFNFIPIIRYNITYNTISGMFYYKLIVDRNNINFVKTLTDYRKCFRFEKNDENTSISYRKKRLKALYLFCSEKRLNRKEIAAKIGVDRKTVGHWLQTYASGGLEALLARNYSPGCPAQLTEEQQQVLLAELKNKVYPNK